MENTKFIPLLLGSDRNVYGMAVSFHEQYGIKSLAIGKMAYLETVDSKIIKMYTDKDIENPKTFMKRLMEIYEENKDKKILLIACSDVYMKLIIQNKKELSKYFLVPYIDEELMNKLVLKEQFYKTCEKYKLDYPKTIICTKKDYKKLDIKFEYPIIIKPSNSVEYWKSSFEGKKKIFISKTKEETNDILNKIYNSTYKDNLIIQEYIEGDDTCLRVLNAYVDQNHKVTFMGLGQIVLEDKTPSSFGDYGAIITSYDKKLFDKMQKFLEEIKYVGYANFDFKYNSKTKEYKLFEINIRQGRSSSFTTVSGCNITKYLVDDFIYNKKNKIEYLKGEYLWTIVPKGVIFKYLKNQEVKEKIKKLYKEKKVRNILVYKNDFSFKRYIKIQLKTLNFYRKYKQYYK